MKLFEVHNFFLLFFNDKNFSDFHFKCTLMYVKSCSKYAELYCNSICISISIESCNMGLKYVFNAYLDLLFTFGACPVCAPKRHSQHLKIGEFSKNFRIFQALGVPFGCTYWARASHPKCAQYESITCLNIIGQLLDLNFVCWFKLGLPKGRHLFNESHILC